MCARYCADENEHCMWFYWIENVINRLLLLHEVKVVQSRSVEWELWGAGGHCLSPILNRRGLSPKYCGSIYTLHLMKFNNS